MKNKIDRMKNRAKGLSKRSLALMLSILVLITAVGAGAVITAIAATTSQSVQNEQERIEATSNLYDTEEKMLGTADGDAAVTLSKKGDVDLAATGYSSFKIVGTYNDKTGDWSGTSLSSAGEDAYGHQYYKLNVTFKQGAEFHFLRDSNVPMSLGSVNVTRSTSAAMTDNKGDNMTWNDGACSVDVCVNSEGHLWFENYQPSATSYAITYETPTNGSFTTAPTSATSGNTVNVVAKPNAGYEVDKFTVTKGDVAMSTTVSGNTCQFTMPNQAVKVKVTFKQSSYTVGTSYEHCSISGLNSSYHYGDTVNFTISPETDYAIKSLSVTQGSTSISVSDKGAGSYSFTMPAGNVTITAKCVSTSGSVTVYFKSATAYVYQPFIAINGGAEMKMVEDRELNNSVNGYKPNSVTGSLRYAWYKAELEGVDTSKPISFYIHGQNSDMEATGTFSVNAGESIYLACDNIYEGNTLVDLTKYASGSTQDLAKLDFYDNPLNMIDD